MGALMGWDCIRKPQVSTDQRKEVTACQVAVLTFQSEFCPDTVTTHKVVWAATWLKCTENGRWQLFILSPEQKSAVVLYIRFSSMTTVQCDLKYVNIITQVT